MSDIIRLLPDSVANQIAAGEVIQRPASVIKELVENCIDANATEIKIFIKDAGRTLIQVIDNGIGMSEIDARMSFERHATSKLKQASDLFEIKTMGFRGEALASIAAIAHVDLITNNGSSALGTRIIIEGSEIKTQEPCTAPVGTSFSVKNLFYNVPARRNFLKSNNLEFNHILNEFTRIALAYPKISFTLHHQEKLIYQLERSNLLQRIVSLHGNSYKQNLVPLNQLSEVVNISGYISKPEAYRKDKKNQYFFVNGRFIKHPYLNHAIEEAYEELLPSNSFATYFIFFEIDPKRIDINIHPTKTEVKFMDDSVIYAILKATVKRSLGIHNLTPSMDFEISQDLEYVEKKNPDEIIPPKIHINPDYNPFKSNQSNSYNQNNLQNNINRDKWEKIFSSKDSLKGNVESKLNNSDENAANLLLSNTTLFNGRIQPQPIQLHGKYIIAQIKSGLMIIDQKKAFERIFYEKKLQQVKNKKCVAQQLLFPELLELSVSEINIVKELKDIITSIGFTMEFVDDRCINFIGIPNDFELNEIHSLITQIINEHENGNLEEGINIDNTIAYAFAITQSKYLKKVLKPEEINHLIDELFACNMHETALDGSKIIIKISLEEINQKFINF